MKKIIEYFKNNNEKATKLLILFVGIITIIIISIILIVIFHKNDTTKNLVTFDEKPITVYDTKEKALQNTIKDVTAEPKYFSVNTKKRLSVSTENDLLSKFKISNVEENNYEIDLTDMADQKNIVIKLQIGGDGSFVGRALDEDIDCYFFAITIKNDNPPKSSNEDDTENDTEEKQNDKKEDILDSLSSLGHPVSIGEIKFGDVSYLMYDSETEAQSSSTPEDSTIPKEFVSELEVSTYKSSEYCARIWVTVCMIDQESRDMKGVILTEDNNWSNTLDLSAYQGHQVTLEIQAEDELATNLDIRYVSFFIPNI